MTLSVNADGSVVTGSSATGGVVFTLTLNKDTGSVTFDQQRAVVHSNTSNPDDSRSLSAADLITLTGTIVDGDGESATATLNIGQTLNFEDDGPTLNVAAGPETGVVLTTQDAETIGTASDTDASTANFSGVFSISSAYGADGAGIAPVLGYTLSLAVASGSDSGFDSNGVQVNLYNVGGVIVGSTSATQAGITAGNTIFSISVNSSGAVTLTQFAEIDHALEGTTTAPFDDQFAILGDGLVNLTASATITDGDGDTATDSEVIDLGGNIRFADDGPTLNVAKGTETGILLTTQDAET
ncbi:MAG: DUF5801 domain-containing protein, partial [Cyanobium sp. LacPavin_0818_WC50_MAG_67_9]|nr:DUF5801 domain-containing protein [Cyanobium sp. LacPavin_0818_WC50_MAG_67_9]